MIDLNKIKGIRIPEKQYTIRGFQFDLMELQSLLYDVLRCDSDFQPFQELFSLVQTILDETFNFFIKKDEGMDTEQTEKRLIRISLEFSEIAEAGVSEMKKISQEVQKTGKPVEEFSIGELLTLFRENNDEYSWMYLSLEGV